MPPRSSPSWPIPTVVAIASDRAARINGLTIIDGNVGDHPEAYTRFVSVAPVHAARSPRRPVAHGVLVHDRPPPRSALPRTRATRPPRHRPQPARLATDSVAAVQLPLRRRPRRPSARPRDLRDPEGDARPDGAASGVRLVPRRPRGRRGRANACRAVVTARGRDTSRAYAAAGSNCSSDGRYWRQLSGTRLGREADEQHGRRRPRRPRQRHRRLLEQPVALAEIARRTRGDDVLPDRVAALRARDHVVERQPTGRRAAVDALPAVAGKERAPRDPPLDGPRHPHVLEEADHVRADERALGRSERLRAARRPRPCPSTRGRARAGRSTR